MTVVYSVRNDDGDYIKEGVYESLEVAVKQLLYLRETNCTDWGMAGGTKLPNSD